MEPRTEFSPWPTATAGGALASLLAAETGAPYAVLPVSPVAGGLDRVAELAERRDRDMGELVRTLVAVSRDEGLADLTGGMSLHVWLQHTARCTRREAREVLGAVDVLGDMPSTLAGLGDGWLSWSQTAALCRAARRVRVSQRGELDVLVGGAMVAHREWEPDALVQDVWAWVDARRLSRLERAEAAAERRQVLTLQPNLFGGGSLYAELGTVGFGIVAEALDAPLGPPVALPDDLSDTEGVEAAFDEVEARRRALTCGHGAALADRLVALCERDLAGATGADEQRMARPLVLATVDVEALLDQSRVPGFLLHTLVGGRMQVSSTTLQRLVDRRGADLRTIVLDDCGEVVGIGTTSRVPPQALREAIWARDLVVRDPDGSTPIRRADLDHVLRWPAGPTEATNLVPLGRSWHNRKTSKHWTLARARDGTVTWTHRRHGWQIRLAPPRRDLTDVPDPGPPRLPLDDLDDVGRAPDRTQVPGAEVHGSRDVSGD